MAVFLSEPKRLRSNCGSEGLSSVAVVCACKPRLEKHARGSNPGRLSCHSAHFRSLCSLLCLYRPSPRVDGEPF